MTPGPVSNDARVGKDASKDVAKGISLKPSSPVEAAKQLAAYAAVDDHIKPAHKVIGIGYVWVTSMHPMFRRMTCHNVSVQGRRSPTS
jgi:hypothetical protein